ncbi:hypothetical protein KIN20_030492 [Parelaphostrongylus tenuis]|uniref:Lipoprotein n=1 Tax=Parelaphostrongylus tenuis TaxID=148309 RepID=A0AAD5WGC2_PARTN|nr:hypothetical protein KIN20_030492 [Parelaphostrongylus tenuis]
MSILTYKAIISTDSFTILLLTTITIVSGCGVMPAGQASTRSFTVTGFTLPVAMAYTDIPAVSARVPGIAVSSGSAQAFVSRLVMQTVFDVLENQARSAFLPDAVISAILGQVEVKVTYRPMLCQKVHLGLADKTDMVDDKKKETSCIIIDNTVTGICH